MKIHLTSLVFKEAQIKIRFPFFFFLKILVIYLLERGKEGERKGEKH